MFVIRDVMHCKPGQVRPMIEKFKALGKAMKKGGYKGKYQIMTDVSAEQYWTAVFELEVESLDGYEEMVKKSMSDPAVREIMKDYHELIESGRREIYRLEK